MDVYFHLDMAGGRPVYFVQSRDADDILMKKVMVKGKSASKNMGIGVERHRSA